MTELKLTPFGVIQKYAEDEGLAWSATHADAILDRLKREGYQVVDAPKATDQPCDRTPPARLKNHDRIVTGLHGQWLGDVIGVHETVAGEEVMMVIIVPAESVYEVAGRTPEAEVWKDMPGFPGRQVNQYGRFQTVERQS